MRRYELDIAREESDLVGMQRTLANLTAFASNHVRIEAMARCSF
jgi:hypothetical protein